MHTTMEMVESVKQARILSVRPLTLKELRLCEPYGQAFFSEKGLPGEFSIAAFVKKWTAYITQYNGILLGLWDGEQLVGGLGGMVAPDINTDELSAIEFLLFIDPRYRGGDGWVRLVERFWQFGQAKGATRKRLATMLLPDEDPFFRKSREGRSMARALDRIYRKRWGLRPVEIGYDGPM